MARRIIGLDIGYDSVTAVCLKGKPANFQLAGRWREPLAVDSDDAWAEKALSALRKIRKKFPKGNYTLVTALNRSETMLQNLSFPFSDFQKIRQVARFDVEPYLPFPIEQVLLDIYVLAARDNSAEVMVVGAPVQTIEDRLALLESANLKPDVITLDALGLAAASYRLRGRKDNRTLIILDIGARHSVLNIVAGGKLHYSRGIDSGETEILEKPCSDDRERCLPLLKEINFSLR